MGTSEVPVGTVIAFAGNKAPKGWLECDGSRYSKDEYPDLFDAIGTIHGGDADEGFYVPDYRGLFLRGVDGGRGKDTDAGSRYSPQASKTNPGSKGDAVGSLQDDAFAVHDHANGPFNRVLRVTNGDTVKYTDVHGSNEPELTECRPLTKQGGSETRPKNASVIYFILAGKRRS